MASNSETLRPCDIIMKGGITSGVVYPRAISEIAKQFQFRSIGGTSAGAIAAVVTAAAEYNRGNGGFKVIEELPKEVPTILLSLFQPAPRVRPVFNAALNLQGKRYADAALGLLGAVWPAFVAGFALFAIAAVWLLLRGNWIAALAFIVLGLIGGLAVAAFVLVKTTLSDLKALDFGCCPGRTQPGNATAALSDWLADKIELAAGRMADGRRPEAPLTFEDVWTGADRTGSADHPKLNLQMMTTNLSLRRPNTLPGMDHNHFFKEAEFRRLFPDWVVDYLVKAAGAIETRSPPPPGCLPFPAGGKMPLVVAARMSLSFPILFSAVPLYRFKFLSGGRPPVVERMLFSDGGLSSNFPVHFFDAPLPGRPTFGVSLEDFDDAEPNRRLQLPMPAREGIGLDGTAIASLPDFLASVIYAAKDWQDRLQSVLPGYRERITSIYLHPTEGGLNLNMPQATIDTLMQLGGRAGALMSGAPTDPADHTAFDFDDHRWRRYLVTFARIEETLQTSAQAWQANGFANFVANYMQDPASYTNSTQQWRREVFERFDTLMKAVSAWGQPLRTSPQGHIPKPATDMRITAKP